MLRKVYSERGALHQTAAGLSFGLYSAQEVRDMSVVNILTPLSFNALGHPLPNGLYDLRMGPTDHRGMCETCQQGQMYCPGHFGHVELPLPVINPLFSKTLLQLCRLSCLKCQYATLPGMIKQLCVTQLKLLRRGLVKEAVEAEQVLTEAMALEQDGKKLKASRGDNEEARAKFQHYLNNQLPDGLLSGSSELEASTQNAEQIRQAVTRRVLSYAKQNVKCAHCNFVLKKMMLDESKLVYRLGAHERTPRKGSYEYQEGDVQPQKYLTPMEAMEHLRKTWANEEEFLSQLFPVLASTTAEYPTDLFFIQVVSVPPPKNRPAQVVNSAPVEHPQNLALRNVVSSGAMLSYAIQAKQVQDKKRGSKPLSKEAAKALEGVKGNSYAEKMETVWLELQRDVDHLLDRDRGSGGRLQASQLLGLKQVIEKKEGLFRMNMMGKRVNHAARTVITPDPMLHIEEIGVPDVFARALTFPTPVTPWNVAYLRRLVINGPHVHPGAVSVENELGQVSRLSDTDRAQREGIAARLLVADKAGLGSFRGVKTVYRHLQNGDRLLLNRQPSLHRPSIMGHRTRVLYGDKVFRLHYANCKHYNADFDGDEMNAHFPQSQVARSEAAHLVNVCSHFLVPKDGTPLGGLIQDHIVGAVKMTVRGRFFCRADYEQLVYFALSNSSRRIVTEPPTILWPQVLWSGKQVVTTIVRNLVPTGRRPPTFTSSAKIKSDEWRQEIAREFVVGGTWETDSMSESQVIFRHGELVCGILDKVHLGATPFGLCHAFYELYGDAAVGDLLSAFSRLMTNFLQWEGFTLGVRDVLVLPHADKLRRLHMVEASGLGPEAAASGVGIPTDSSPELLREKLEVVHRSRDLKARAIVDLAYKQTLDQVTNQINRSCLPHGLVRVFPGNNLQLLVQSGAKGSTVNTMQMSCLLGQIELEGKRPGLTLSGKSLPSFRAYDPSPRAGGFIAGRFLTGIRPQEFFFHCMAGREGLIDTAVKTSRSGYLQRCLVKLLEGLVTQYDGTVRDSDGSVIQWLYGEDGLDVCRSQYLQTPQMPFLRDNAASVLDPRLLRRVKELGPRQEVAAHKKQMVEWTALNGSRMSKLRQSPWLKFFEQHAEHMPAGSGYDSASGRSLNALHLMQQWRQLSPHQRNLYESMMSRCPEPLLSQQRPDASYGVVSERLEDVLHTATRGLDVPTASALSDVVYYKAMRALSSPGDAVGVLAAQSIGEPSTQMTLNTFHFAGRGEMNVTLGIPRLREILMVASARIKTPAMEVPFLPTISEKATKRLRIRLTRVTLAQVLQNVEVRECMDTVAALRVFRLRFNFLAPSEYRQSFCVSPADILRYFERTFLRTRLLPALHRVGKSKRGPALVEPKRGVNKRPAADAEPDAFADAERAGMGEDHQSSDEEPEAEDADATEKTRRARHAEAEYEEPEEEERLPEPEAEEETETPEAPPEQEEEPESSVVPEALAAEMRVSAETHDTRVGTVLAMDEYVGGYEFDRADEQFCIITIKMPLKEEKVNLSSVLRAEAERGVIHEVPGIGRAFVSSDANGTGFVLKTEGINILAMSEHRALLQLDRLYCNNIHVMAEHYGIEAASKVIVKEMRDVFKAYGIAIDPRHLSLIADFMTFSGVYRPFNRHGIQASASPLHQMSFETVIAFLQDATLSGRRDELANPSARLVVGRPAAVGTGLFGLQHKQSPLAKCRA